MSESIVKNEIRVGRFTSSQIFSLIPSNRPYKKSPFQQKGYSYILSRSQERKRKKSMSLDASSAATAWGDLMEYRVYDLVGLEYSLESRSTTVHPEYAFWSGSRDMIVPGQKIAEIKGYYPEKFCNYADALLSEDLDRIKTDYSQEYWQIVSNAVINQVPKGEAILYQPYESEADEIATLCEDHPDLDNLWQFKRIQDNIISEDLHKLPFQPDDSDYPNLITFEFEIPKEDIELLTERVLLAESFLRKNFK